jgi:kelch-like protein 20
LYGKIYAFGGGDGIGCFSEVEVFDPAQGKWIKSQPMLEKVHIHTFSTYHP